MVQSRLDVWMSDAGGVPRRDLEVTRRLTLALMITGFAMQASCSSRPVSGAEHQFSHLWDMEHHTYRGITPSHGFKVGIGSLASLGLYEAVLAYDFEKLDVDAAVNAWPTLAENDAEIDELFEIPELRQKAILESTTKYIDHEALRVQLEQLKRDWPRIRDRLARAHDAADAAARLAARRRLPGAIRRHRHLARAAAAQLPQGVSHSPAVHDLRSGSPREHLGPVRRPRSQQGELTMPDADARSYKYWQWRILLSALVGYAMFYFVRKNISVAAPIMYDKLGITKGQFGLFLTLHGLVYGVSKFVNGFFGDRLNARWFMPFGLVCCAVVNIFFGLSTSLVVLGVLWMINGWFQGIGFPPCARLMTHWFSPREFATKMAIWNSSHSLGAGLIFILCGYLAPINWRLCFFVPAAIVLVVSVGLLVFLRDTPSRSASRPSKAPRMRTMKSSR